MVPPKTASQPELIFYGMLTSQNKTDLLQELKTTNSKTVDSATEKNHSSEMFGCTSKCIYCPRSIDSGPKSLK